MIKSIISRYLLLLTLFSSPTIQQAVPGNETATGSGNGTTVARPIPGTFPNGTCDPFHAVCPSYTNGIDACDPVMVAGQIIVNSPNDTSYFYVNEDINVTVSYTSNTDPA